MKKTDRTFLRDVLRGFLISAIFASALPIPALAQDLGTTVNHLVSTQLSNIPNLLSGIFYIGGIAYAGAGLLKLKQHADNPGQTKLAEGVGRIAVGGGLMALPYFSRAIVNTFDYGTTAVTYTTFTPVQ